MLSLSKRKSAKHERLVEHELVKRVSALSIQYWLDVRIRTSIMTSNRGVRAGARVLIVV